MENPKITELQEKASYLANLLSNPTPLYNEYIYKDDEKTVRPDLKLKHVDELNDALIRISKDVEEFRDSLGDVALPLAVSVLIEDSINNKDSFINKGTVNWDKESGFIDPNFSIENNTLFFRFKNEDLVDYVEINEISPDGKVIVTTQGGTVGDGLFIKVPVVVDYLEKDSVPGTKYTVTIVIGDGRRTRQRKGFFTYIYK